MVVMTAKVSKAKLIAILCILAAVICIIAYALFGGNDDSTVPDGTANAASNEGRIAFLASYGWQVDETPTETQDVRIPEEMNEVFMAYNELQRSQGYDLSQFAGQKVQRYVYQVTNYAGASAPVYASVLVCDGNVIGGDITSTAGAGMMHGFEAPAGSQNPLAPSDAGLPQENTAQTQSDALAEAAQQENAQQENAQQEQPESLPSDAITSEEESLLPTA